MVPELFLNNNNWLPMKLSRKNTLLTVSLALTSCSLLAAIPQNYYQNVDNSNPANLKQSLHLIIKDHTKIPYTSSSTDTWDVLELADQDPDNSANVIDIYKNASYTKAGGGNTFYNREHSWPKSYGFPNDGSNNYPYTDLHHLFIADSSYNSSRSNKPYAECNDASCLVKTTEVNNQRGGGSLDVNLTIGSGATGSWQTWPARRGDVARALMYLAVRYEGGSHGITGVLEPDLVLTDDRNLIEASNTGGNESIAYMGLKSTLIAWHKADPVDDFERRHNDAVYQHQGNRNPFVDHPEYVACVFESQCSGTTPVDTAPAAPSGLNANAGDSMITLSWNANAEQDFAHYTLAKEVFAGAAVNLGVQTTPSYQDTSVVNGTQYRYQVVAVDNAGNTSTAAITQWLTPTATQTSAAPWINELHYDNDGTDVNEGVEIAGQAGLDLNGWQLIAYNGNGGTQYKTVMLSGVIANQNAGFGTLFFAMSGLQNGAPDGIALVNNKGELVQFISYEGSFTATDGPASGNTSIDIGIAETSTTAIGLSLQLTGQGTQYADFTWQLVASTYNGVNAGQSFGDTPPVVEKPSFFENTQSQSIPDRASIDSIIAVEREGAAGSVTIAVDIAHTYRGDISLVLVAPDGSSYTLRNRDGKDGGQNVVESYTLDVTGDATGNWKLTVRDNYRQDVGTLNSWSVRFN